MLNFCLLVFAAFHSLAEKTDRVNTHVGGYSTPVKCA